MVISVLFKVKDDRCVKKKKAEENKDRQIIGKKKENHTGVLAQPPCSLEELNIYLP